MDCRKFHKNLEDYLEDGLDFAGRFGMERHARQCINCGRAMADAQQIRKMVSGLERVKAPENFEASVINEIARRKLNARATGIRRFWIHGYEVPLWRKLALASSGMAILAVGVFAVFNLTGSRQDLTSPVAMEESRKPDTDAKAPPSSAASAARPSTIDRIGGEEGLAITEASNAVEALEVAVAPQEPRVTEPKPFPEWDTTEAELIEHLIMGADGRPITIQLPMPRKIYMQLNQTSEDYYIQNISH